MRQIRAFLLAIPLMLMAAPVALAADTDEVIKYRKAVMQTVGHSLKSISLILRGQLAEPEAGAALADHAAILAATTRRSLYAFSVNTAGQGYERTTALARIWQGQAGQKFRADLQKLAGHAANLSRAAAAGDQAGVGAGLRAVGGTCKACHQDYRSK